ncbi:hypothetical protein [Stenotrophomonas sp. PS02289]|uniref:hypothetical protein n=1 Tax=Stenotrophomonas sp. PS02289 TaxID=2991422 RepID=UPI00249C7754|nr:hypothetical protein [Stenotrophomonas sp. PS02289]
MALIRHDSLIRLFAAGFCVIAALYAFASLFITGSWWGLLTAPLFALLAFILHARDWRFVLRRMSAEEREAELERKGEITHEVVKARRAIHLFDYSCSCDVYLIDCEDGRLLCLFGQYFYDWEPIEENGTFIQGRGFPTREFVITRRAPDAWVYRLQPGKTLIHPEIVGGDIDLLAGLGLKLSSSDGTYLPTTYDEVRQIMERAHA